MKNLMKNKVAMFGFAIICLIVGILFYMAPGVGLSLAIVFPLVMKIGDQEFTVKDEAEKEQFEQLQKMISAIIDKSVAGLITESAMKKAIEDKIAEKGFKIADDAEFQKQVEAITKLGLEITAMRENGESSSKGPRTLGQAFKAHMLANPDTFKNLSPGSEIKLTLKVAGNMLDSTNVTGTVPAAFREPGLVDAAQERRFIMDIIGYGPTTNKTIEFVEKKNQDGTVIFVDDTEAFAQIDFDLDVNSSSAKDVGAFITVHENMLADIDFMATEIDRELIYQIRKKADSEIMAGAGTTKYLKGIITYATAGFSLTTIKVLTPNVGDCISAAMTQVESVGFDEANMIVLHPADYNNLIGTKDDNGRYVGHPLLSPDGQSFAGIPISRSTFITAGYLLVGNKLKSHIKMLEDVKMAIGYNLTGEFAKRLITVRGGMRLHHYIYENDVNSFVYDAIQDIKDAITQV